MKVAINIDTNDWRSLVDRLYKSGWRVIEKYIGYDASVDFDFLILSKNNKSIKLGWDHFYKGEVKCDKECFYYLESLIKFEFQFGQAQVLSFSYFSTIKFLCFLSRFIRNKEKLMNEYFYFEKQTLN